MQANTTLQPPSHAPLRRKPYPIFRKRRIRRQPCCKLHRACQQSCGWGRIGSSSMRAIEMSHRTYMWSAMTKSQSSGSIR